VSLPVSQEVTLCIYLHFKVRIKIRMEGLCGTPPLMILILHISSYYIKWWRHYPNTGSIVAAYQTSSWDMHGAPVSNKSLSPPAGCDECFAWDPVWNRSPIAVKARSELVNNVELEWYMFRICRKASIVHRALVNLKHII